MRFNLPMIFSLMGIVSIINGLFMALCIPVALFYEEPLIVAFGISSALAIGAGFFLRQRNRGARKELTKRDGYLIVTLSWLTMIVFGAAPYLISGAIPNVTNAFFEAVSGYTTTGATILTDIESMPKSLLLWRSLTQWIGGMGIIVLAVAILPILGIGGMGLFVAEAPGVSTDKMHPRIAGTARRLWFIYVFLTATEAVLLWLGDMPVFDAINHAMTTVAIGGFSTSDTSFVETSPYIQYVVMAFMVIAGVNFNLLFLGFRGRFRAAFRNEEFRYYLLALLFFVTLTTIVVMTMSPNPVEQTFRDASFQAVSIITTTGYSSADYTAWTPFLTTIFLLMMFSGGSSGSTAGGIKIVRHVILIKNSLLELKRQLNPSAILPLRFSGKAVADKITSNVLAFFVAYITIFAIGFIIMTALGMDVDSAMGSVAATIGNVGPGIGSVGPAETYAEVPWAGKWVLSFFMLLGRLELFTILVILTPHFWRRI